MTTSHPLPTVERVRDVILPLLGITDFVVTPDTRLIADLQADSLDLMEITMALEDEFGVEIHDDEISEHTAPTVQQVIDLVTRRMQGIPYNPVPFEQVL